MERYAKNKSMYFWFPVSWRQNSLMERESPLNQHPQSYRWSVRSHKNCGLEPHLRGDEHLQNKLKHNAMRFDIFHFQDQVNLGGRPKPKCWSQVVKSHTHKNLQKYHNFGLSPGGKNPSKFICQRVYGLSKSYQTILPTKVGSNKMAPIISVQGLAFLDCNPPKKQGLHYNGIYTWKTQKAKMDGWLPFFFGELLPIFSQ